MQRRPSSSSRYKTWPHTCLSGYELPPSSSASLCEGHVSLFWIIELYLLLHNPTGKPVSLPRCQILFPSASPFLCCVSLTGFSKRHLAHSVSILRVLTSPSFSLCPVTETPLKITDLQISNAVITFLSSVSLEPLSLLYSYHGTLIPSFLSTFLVASWQAYLQMLFSTQGPYLEPHHSHSTHLPPMASHPSHLG